MATNVKKVQGFIPLSDDGFNKTLGEIGKLGGNLLLKLKIAALNAVYYSIVAGRAEHANALLQVCPKFYKQGLVSYLERAGKLQLVGKGKDQKFAYNARPDLPPQSAGQQAAIAYLNSQGEVILAKPKTAKTVPENFNWHEAFSVIMSRESKRQAGLKQAGANQEHEQLFLALQATFLSYQRENMGIGYSPEEVMALRNPAKEIVVEEVKVSRPQRQRIQKVA